MFVLSIYCMSDVAMGDGNPQIDVSVHATREEAELRLVKAYNDEWAGDEGDDEAQPRLSEFAKVAELFDGFSLPECPTFEIQEVNFGQRVWLNWWKAAK
jgi:hypothetical protein